MTNATGPTAAPARREDYHPKDPRLAARVARHIATHHAFSRGDIAQMKRMRPEMPEPAAFWQLMMWRGITDPTGERPNDPTLESCWARIVRAMARSTRVGESETTGPHDPDRPLGAGLARTGYSEARLRILLNAQGETLMRAVEGAAHWMGIKNEGFNWPEAAALMMSGYRTPAQRDDDRMRIARSYYGAKHQEE